MAYLESDAFDADPLPQPRQHGVDKRDDGDEGDEGGGDGREHLDRLRRPVSGRLDDVPKVTSSDRDRHTR